MTSVFSKEGLTHLNLSEKIQEILKQKIIRQQIAPGAKLVEDTIAQEFGVSRTPVREALKVLRRSEVVEYVPRKGTYVTQLGKKDIDELYDMRMVLEGLAANRATLLIGEEDLTALLKDLESAEQQLSQGNMGFFVDVDTRFHDMIIANCGNRRLQDQLNLIHDLILMYRSWGVTQCPRVRWSLAEHWEVFKGMTQRDEKYAEKCMLQHIELTKQWLLEKYPFER